MDYYGFIVPMVEVIGLRSYALRNLLDVCWRSYLMPSKVVSLLSQLDTLLLNAEKDPKCRKEISNIAFDWTFGDYFDLPFEVSPIGVESVAADLADAVQSLPSFVTSLLDPLSPPELELLLVPALVLAIVYQYLFGSEARGGTKIYNSGSLEFGVTFVSLLLFQAAHLWIKFRDVDKRNVSRRTNKLTGNPVGKFLPKFKPFREKDRVTGRTLSFQNLRLGGYDTEQDAKVVRQIAGFYYARDERLVQLDDGFEFRIPPMSEQKRGLSGDEKWDWVSNEAKKVFKSFKQDHDRWREILRAFEDDVVQPEQSADNVNHRLNSTLPQPLADVSEVLEAVSGAGTEGTQMSSGAADHDYQLRENLSSPDSRSEQGGSSAHSGPTSARAVRGAVSGAGILEQALFDVPTTISIFERADGTLSISGDTAGAGFSCGINENEEGQDLWFTGFLRIMSGDVELPTREQGAAKANLSDTA